jgi:hypothetical protein
MEEEKLAKHLTTPTSLKILKSDGMRSRSPITDRIKLSVIGSPVHADAHRLRLRAAECAG